MSTTSALAGAGMLVGFLSFVVAVFFLLRYGYRFLCKDEKAKGSLRAAGYAAVGIGVGIVLLIVSFLSAPNMDASSGLFLLALLVGSVSVATATFFALQYYLRRGKDEISASRSKRRVKYSAAGFGVGVVLFICAFAGAPAAPTRPAMSPEERAQQEAYDKQAQYEEWIAWQESEKEKAEDAALQDAYDKQAQYEEWMEWQASEKKKEEDAALQDAYDKQAQYEEWIAWQASEREKAAAEENKYLQCTADQMLADYENNSARSGKTYRNQYVKVKGRVAWIGNNGFLLDGIDEDEVYNGAIRCNTQREDYGVLLKLNKGEIITLYGYVKSVGGAVAESTFNGAEIHGYDIDVYQVE